MGRLCNDKIYLTFTKVVVTEKRFQDKFVDLNEVKIL